MYSVLINKRQKADIRGRVKRGHLFIRIFTLSVVIRILIQILSPIKIVKWLDNGLFMIKKISLKSAINYTDIITRYKVKDGKCLLRALILFRLFKKAGLSVSINFGVNRDINSRAELDGHSWICINGSPVLENSNPEELYELIHSHNAIPLY